MQLLKLSSFSVLVLVLGFNFAIAKDTHTEPAHDVTSKKESPISEKSNTKKGWEAFQEIQSGNKRFAEGKPSNSGQDKAAREKLVTGQQPPVIVLSCSDSRVPPEKIFDQGLGQIFTVRLAGHVLNSDAIASIEYAIEHLSSKTLVVMGHESCGAVKAALTTPKGKSTGSVYIDGLIAKIKPGIAAFKVSENDKTIEGPVRANVSATVKDLVKRSKIVREAAESNNLLIAQGIYHLGSGEVEFWSVGQPIVIMDGTKSKKQDEVVQDN